MSEFDDKPIKQKKTKKISKQRLKNIALYYLKRFDSSVENLRQVLKRRVNDYVFYNPDFNKNEAHSWIEEILADFERLKYLDDFRYAEIKIQSYLNAGKPERYIKIKMQQKGINTSLVEQILENQTYSPFEMALKFAKKKKIGPFRNNEDEQRANRQKDLATIVRAGFDYDVALDVLEQHFTDDDI